MTAREDMAGEYVLGLLEGQDLLTARGLMASDPGFAASVAAWEAQFAPLFDAAVPVTPPARVWRSIDEAIGALRAPEVVALRRRIRRWQIGTGVAAALAGVLAIVMVVPATRPTPVPLPLPQAAPPLAAAMAPKGEGSFSVVYHPDKRELVALAPELPAHKGRDLELWLLPKGAQPLSLGVVVPGGTQRAVLRPEIAAQLTPGATLAVSLEPVGGSPTGLPTGPVLGTAKISPA